MGNAAGEMRGFFRIRSGALRYGRAIRIEVLVGFEFAMLPTGAAWLVS